jgi:hypothetical protein
LEKQFFQYPAKVYELVIAFAGRRQKPLRRALAGVSW